MAPGSIVNFRTEYDARDDCFKSISLSKDYVGIEVPGTAGHPWHVCVEATAIPAGLSIGSRLTVSEFSAILLRKPELASLLATENFTMSESTELIGPSNMINFVSTWASWATFSHNTDPSSINITNNNNEKGTSAPSLHL